MTTQVRGSFALESKLSICIGARFLVQCMRNIICVDQRLVLFCSSAVDVPGFVNVVVVAAALLVVVLVFVPILFLLLIFRREHLQETTVLLPSCDTET